MGNFISFTLQSIPLGPTRFLGRFISRVEKRELGPKLYNRATGRFTREKLPIKLWLENGIMYSRPIDMIDRFGFIRNALKNENINSEHVNNKYASSRKIAPFVDFFNINMDDFVQDNPNLYKTFNDFFIRDVKKEKRPVASSDDVIISVADCRLSVFSTMQQAEQIMIKGKHFTLEKLITNGIDKADEQKARNILNIFTSESPAVNSRLAPMDYHHFHSPVSGKITDLYHIPGEYFTVEPKALKSDINVLGENARTVAVIESKHYGRVLFVAIGAEAVGTVVFTVHEGDNVEKGDRIGHFEYGGSDVLMLFEKSVEWDHDVTEVSKRGYESLTYVGEKIGVFR